MSVPSTSPGQFASRSTMAIDQASSPYTVIGLRKEIPVAANESYRIHERIRALNDLGFSVGEVDLVASGESDHLRMRTIVTVRNFHSLQLHNISVIVEEEKHGTLLIKEIVVPSVIGSSMGTG